MVIISMSYFAAIANISTRTSCLDFKDTKHCWIALDFKVNKGEHLTAPTDKGKSFAPTFAWNTKGVTITDVIWPEAKAIKDTSGEETGFYGYEQDFSVLLSLSLTDDSIESIDGEVSYVSCGDSCTPIDSSLSFKADGKLSQSEIKSAILQKSSHGGFFILILLSFLGGIVLNGMPCVFPIISLKIFSMIKNAKLSSDEKKKNGIMYCIGCVFSFFIIGTTLLLLRNAGHKIGWGFFMQSPTFVTIFSISFVLAALSMFGILHIPSFVKKRNTAILKSCKLRPFFEGIACSISSATCVGPFVGAVISYALLSESSLKSLLLFICMGLGVSLPIAATSFIPKAGKLFPKPGNWINILTKIIGFVLLLSVTWIYSILSAQIGAKKLVIIIAFTIIIALSVWIYDEARKSNIKKIIPYTIASLCFITSCAMIFHTIHNQQTKNQINWTAFSFEKLNQLQAEKKPVFIQFTADWCLNCKFNEKVLKSDKITELFKKYNVECIKIDWTNRSPDTTNLLEVFGSSSVPLSVIYLPKSSSPIIISGIVSEEQIEEYFH